MFTGLFDLKPILHEEVEIAVAALKRGVSAGANNVPAELVQAGGETITEAGTVTRSGEQKNGLSNGLNH